MSKGTHSGASNNYIDSDGGLILSAFLVGAVITIAIFILLYKFYGV